MRKEIQISPRQIAKAIDDLLDENEQLHSIIKKVREYIENTYEDFKNEDGSLPMTLHDQKILEILDKENK